MKIFIYTTVILTAFLANTALVAFADGSSASARGKLQEIADNAEVANGSASVKSYDVRALNAQAALNKDLKAIKKEYPKCGPFRITKDRRETMAAVQKATSDATTVRALEDLYRQNKIIKMYSVLTNNEIDCSRMWVAVFTSDGLLLEIYYGMND